MKTLALSALEQILNKLLRLDPEIGRLLAPLDTKTIAITLKGLNLTVYCYFGDESVYLMSDSYTEPHASIAGTPLALLAAKYDPQTAATQGKITIEGEDETIQAFNQLLQQLHIDWEDVLSKVFGDTIATRMGRLVRQMKHSSHASTQHFASHVGEYLQHEMRVLPPRQEIDDFCNDVDNIRNDTERLFARWQHWQTMKDK